MTTTCKLAYVSGRVQGVWYRGSTQKQALQFGLSGWAKNLPDGRVEVLMVGDRTAIDKLVAWLHEGPELAKVSSVDIKELETDDFDAGKVPGFQVL